MKVNYSFILNWTCQDDSFNPEDPLLLVLSTFWRGTTCIRMLWPANQYQVFQSTVKWMVLSAPKQLLGLGSNWATLYTRLFIVLVRIVFQNALDSFPELSVATELNTDCETPVFKVRLSGRAYNRKTMKPSKSPSKVPLVSLEALNRADTTGTVRLFHFLWRFHYTTQHNTMQIRCTNNKILDSFK